MTLQPIAPVEGIARWEVPGDGETGPQIADVVGKDDLDGDGRADLVLRYEDTCGNRGECMIGVFAACGNNEYVAVLPPDYHYELAIGSSRAGVASWKVLVLTERGEYRPLPMRTLEFDGVQYRAPIGSRETQEATGTDGCFDRCMDRRKGEQDADGQCMQDCNDGE
jgi:hypothetical protein